MAKKSRVTTVDDFIPFAFEFSAWSNDKGELTWMVSVRGNEFDSAGQIVNQNVAQAIELPAALANDWEKLKEKLLRAAKVKLGLDDGAENVSAGKGNAK